MKPAIVLLPGLDGTGTLFGELVPALEADFESIVVRYPPDLALGYAESEAIARKSLPGDRPFLLLGESFSGPIAISIAASAPQGLAGLVLCASFVDCPRPFLAAIWPLVRRLPLYSAAPTFHRFFAGQFSSDKLRSSLEAARRSVDEEVMKARLTAVCSADFSSELRRVRVPILYLKASMDRIVPHSAARRILRLVPSVRMVEIEGPHYLLQACARRSAEAIRQFAKEIGA